MKFLTFHKTCFVLFLIHLSSCAPGLLQPQHKRSIARDAPIDTLSSSSSHTNLTLPNWPRPPFTFSLVDGYTLGIHTATPYSKCPPPAVPLVRAFIRDFADNLAHAYPPPALAPKRAGQSEYDVQTSFTKLQISESVPFYATTAPTEIVVAALVRMSLEVKRHNPPAELGGFILYGPKQRVRNEVVLEITPLEKGEVADDGSADFMNTA